MTSDQITELKAENKELRALLKSVLAACDKGRWQYLTSSSLPIEEQVKGAVRNGVPAWPIEEALAALHRIERDRRALERKLE